MRINVAIFIFPISFQNVRCLFVKIAHEASINVIVYNMINFNYMILQHLTNDNVLGFNSPIEDHLLRID